MKKSILLLLILSLIACTQDVAKKEKELKVKEGDNLWDKSREFLQQENITPTGGIWIADEKGKIVNETPPKGTYKNYKIKITGEKVSSNIPITLIVE